MTDNLKLLPPPEKKVAQQESTELQVFKPTEAMSKWLDTAIEYLTTSPTNISRESGLDRTNWYIWIKIDGFEDWFYGEYKKRRKRILPKLDEIGMKFASKGDYNFWKDMNKKAGESLEEKETFAGELTKDGARFVITRGED